jgi:hypothetical protein
MSHAAGHGLGAPRREDYIVVFRADDGGAGRGVLPPV